MEAGALNFNLGLDQTPMKVDMAQRKTNPNSQSPPEPDDRQLYLPAVAEFMRTMPNHLARSSLFAPVARGRKRELQGEALTSRADAQIKFWGPQLDEAQSDVWMQAMYAASKVPIGAEVVINRSQFLVSIGRDKGKSQYEWLKRAMNALHRSVIEITVRSPDGRVRRMDSLSMISGFTLDEPTGTYVLSIDKRWRALYGSDQFALIDWKKRLAFGTQQDMAKSLQRLIATSNEARQRYNLEWLKHRLASTAALPNFRRSLKKALAELERLDVIRDSSIEKSTRDKEQVVWTRVARTRALRPFNKN